MAPKGSRHDDEGNKGLTPVAHRLHGDELPVEPEHAVVLAKERVVGAAADVIERGVGPWGVFGGEALHDEVGIGVVGVSGSPVHRAGWQVDWHGGRGQRRYCAECCHRNPMSGRGCQQRSR
jgi:hypothetical protein